MADSVAYQHTDSNCNHDGSDVVYGVKKGSSIARGLYIIHKEVQNASG